MNEEDDNVAPKASDAPPDNNVFLLNPGRKWTAPIKRKIGVTGFT